MLKSCEWVIPKQNVIMCLMPEYIGKPIMDVMYLWGISLETPTYNWYEPIDQKCLLTPGMRINFLSPLSMDPKELRRTRIHHRT